MGVYYGRWIFAFALLGAADATAQDVLTLDQAVARALQNHPRLMGEAARVAAAEGLAQQASLRPNPRLYIQSENNVVGLAVATSEGYFETGRFEIPDKGLPSWAHPVISDGRLYVRNQDVLKVYDIKAPATP